jgi:hypothetical protein
LYGHLVHYLVVIGYIFPVLACCTEKYLATPVVGPKLAFFKNWVVRHKNQDYFPHPKFSLNSPLRRHPDALGLPGGHGLRHGGKRVAAASVGPHSRKRDLGVCREKSASVLPLSLFLTMLCDNPARWLGGI